jgi:NAD(P)-dependent dehydrogenase (short-subunit alcohol dehydrogenase family)
VSLNTNLDGKVALVTGGANGIGAGIANGLREAGAEVIIADLETAGAATDALQVKLDVANMAEVEAVVGNLRRLDILVNAAGIIRRVEEYQIGTFEKVIDVNLSGTMRLCTAARPLLARQGGSIVNIASMLSFFGGGLVPAYSASKGAIVQLTKSLAIGFADDGIRVNAVAPGWIATNLTRALQDDPERAGPILARTPMKRWGRPEDIAGAVVFLCSPSASFITGVILPVDGGYMIV